MPLGSALGANSALTLPNSMIRSDRHQWAIDEFAGRAMLVELFAYLETAESPRADDPALLEVIESYGEWQAGWLEHTIPRLAVSAPSPLPGSRPTSVRP